MREKVNDSVEKETYHLPRRAASTGIARNFMKMKPANRIYEISTETLHVLQDFMCGQRRLKSAAAYTHYKLKLSRSSKENLDVWPIIAKQ